MMYIFRKKDVSKSRTGMKRHLKIHDLILLGIGAMVGTGIFHYHRDWSSQLCWSVLDYFDYHFSALCEHVSSFLR